MGGNQETRTINFEFKSSTIPSFMPSTKSDYVPFELFFSIHVGMIYHHLYTPLDPSYSQRIHYEKAGFHLNQSSNYANLSAFCACARARTCFSSDVRPPHVLCTHTRKHRGNLTKAKLHQSYGVMRENIVTRRNLARAQKALARPRVSPY